jgi:peroxiredoxin
VSLKREVIAQGKKKIQDFSFAQEVSSGKVLVFMFPCTFAKAYISCMEKYREHASSFSVEKIVCVVSDHLTNVNRWHADAQLKEKISFVADLGCELAVLTGLGCDASQRGLGFVLKPSCLLLEGGVVRRIVVAKDLEDLSALSPGSLGMEAVTSAFKRVSISTEQKVSAKKGKE